MAEKRNSPMTKPEKGEFIISRVFDAPRSRVFKAWTDQERLKRWWAPKNFTTPFCKVDLRLGGVFHYCMRSPEGLDIWGIGVYREIVEPERDRLHRFLCGCGRQPGPACALRYELKPPARNLGDGDVR